MFQGREVCVFQVSFISSLFSGIVRCSAPQFDTDDIVTHTDPNLLNTLLNEVLVLSFQTTSYSDAYGHDYLRCTTVI